MEVRWLDDALADVTEIYRYIAADDPRAAGPSWNASRPRSVRSLTCRIAAVPVAGPAPAS